MLTERIGRITPSATLAMTAKAAELRATGRRILDDEGGPTARRAQVHQGRRAQAGFDRSRGDLHTGRVGGREEGDRPQEDRSLLVHLQLTR